MSEGHALRPPPPCRTGRCAGALAALWLALACAGPAAAQPAYRLQLSDYPPPPPGLRGGHPYECDLYARDQAERYVPYGARIGSGAVRGAVGGAVFGAIAGGSKGARRGALAGGGLGAVAQGMRARDERETAYQLAYDDCMLHFRR